MYQWKICIYAVGNLREDFEGCTVFVAVRWAISDAMYYTSKEIAYLSESVFGCNSRRLVGVFHRSPIVQWPRGCRYVEGVVVCDNFSVKAVCGVAVVVALGTLQACSEWCSPKRRRRAFIQTMNSWNIVVYSSPCERSSLYKNYWAEDKEIYFEKHVRILCEMVYFELYSVRKIRHIFKKKTAVGLIRLFCGRVKVYFAILAV